MHLYSLWASLPEKLSSVGKVQTVFGFRVHRCLLAMAEFFDRLSTFFNITLLESEDMRGLNLFWSTWRGIPGCFS